MKDIYARDAYARERDAEQRGETIFPPIQMFRDELEDIFRVSLPLDPSRQYFIFSLADAVIDSRTMVGTKNRFPLVFRAVDSFPFFFFSFFFPFLSENFILFGFCIVHVCICVFRFPFPFSFWNYLLSFSFCNDCGICVYRKKRLLFG